MILIFSSNSNQSKQVSREIERAVARGLFVVPFRIEDISMCKTMEYFLSSPHWLDAITPPLERHLQILVRTVKSLLTPPLTGDAALAAESAVPPAAAAGSATAGVRVPTTFPFWHAIWTTHRRHVLWTMGTLAALLLIVLVVSILISGRRPAGQLVLQRLFPLSTSHHKFGAPALFVACLCDTVSFHPPIAPRHDLVLVPATQID